MDLEEVSELDKRVLGNWATDVFGEVYSSKLPLVAMRVMAGFDKRSGMHHNPRTTFYGDTTHQALAKKIFPWIEGVLENSDLEARATARGFLNYLINLRWVILQDAAVLMAKGRKHFIYDHLSEVFGSDLFKDYQVKMMAHLDRQTHNAPDKAKLDTLLPGVNQRLDNNANATSDMHVDLKSDLKTVIAQNEDMSMDKIEDTVMNSVNSVFGKLGRCMAGFDDVEKSDEEYLQQEIQQTRNPPSPSPYTNVQTGDVPYSVPSKFVSVVSILAHWDTDVEELERANSYKWRIHLTKGERKRFTRMKRVVMGFKAEVKKGLDADEVMAKFEAFYTLHKHSVAKLADVLVKSLKN